jgi:hypothetical protein
VLGEKDAFINVIPNTVVFLIHRAVHEFEEIQSPYTSWRVFIHVQCCGIKVACIRGG